MGTNIDVSYSKEWLVNRGLADRSYLSEEFYDSWYDPHQRVNLINSAEHQEAIEQHRQALQARMEKTDDLLLKGVDQLPGRTTGKPRSIRWRHWWRTFLHYLKRLQSKSKFSMKRIRHHDIL